MSQEEIKKWLQDMATSLEEDIEEKITFRIGECECEYHKGDGEFTTIKGALFLTTHNSHLFTVRDDKQGITDCFCIFGSNDIINIDEDYFTYVISNYKISINQIKFDIEQLKEEFTKFSGAWEYEEGDEYGCTPIAKKELELVKNVASRYPFKYEYNPSDFDENSKYYSDEWYAQDIFTIEDFNNNDVTTHNYGKADAVAFCFYNELIEMLQKLQQELEFLPPRFRAEFLETICYCNQDAHSIRKNAELFLDNIMDELTEEEKSKKFVVIK